MVRKETHENRALVNLPTPVQQIAQMHFQYPWLPLPTSTAPFGGALQARNRQGGLGYGFSVRGLVDFVLVGFYLFSFFSNRRLRSAARNRSCNSRVDGNIVGQEL